MNLKDWLFIGIIWLLAFSGFLYMFLQNEEPCLEITTLSAFIAAVFAGIIYFLKWVISNFAKKAGFKLTQKKSLIIVCIWFVSALLFSLIPTFDIWLGLILSGILLFTIGLVVLGVASVLKQQRIHLIQGQKELDNLFKEFIDNHQLSKSSIMLGSSLRLTGKAGNIVINIDFMASKVASSSPYAPNFEVMNIPYQLQMTGFVITFPVLTKEQRLEHIQKINDKILGVGTQFSGMGKRVFINGFHPINDSSLSKENLIFITQTVFNYLKENN